MAIIVGSVMEVFLAYPTLAYLYAMGCEKKTVHEELTTNVRS